MLLAQVVGTVVATRKDDRLEGKKLLVCRPVSPHGEAEGNYLVAVDTVGAGYQETVLLVSGSSARMAGGFKDAPVDAAIVGIVDEVQLDAGQRRDSRVFANAPGRKPEPRDEGRAAPANAKGKRP